MKRKQVDKEATSVDYISGNTEQKKAKATQPDANLDVQGFFENDCMKAGEQILHHAKVRCDELKEQFASAKQQILDTITSEKENEPENQENGFISLDVFIQCTKGPYKGNEYMLQMDSDRHTICLIGRSTGRKFKLPCGLSLPKDSEISTTHAEIRLDGTLANGGKVFLTDLDSTNGSYMNDDMLNPREPYEIPLSKPVQVLLGGTQMTLRIEKVI